MLLPDRLLPTGRRKAEYAHQRKVLLRTMDDAAKLADDVWPALSDELRAFLRSRVPSESDADDLLQDVFVRVVEKIGSLREADRVESWVYQVARNAIADFYRRRASRPDGSINGAVEGVVDRHGENDAGNQNCAVGAWLSRMIGALPTTLRDAVRMYEIEGLSQAEIANRLGISLSGAKSRVQRGRRQLEELLLGSCQLELDRRGNVLACKPANLDNCAEASCQCNDASQ
ncbi:MAG: RNA polymerase sigma factor SigZ [Pirellulales bacterium]